jgi:hypothetical protein
MTTETTVRALLDAAQITMNDEELQLFVNVYPTLRAGADGLYIPEARSEEPSPVFDPTWSKP